MNLLPKNLGSLATLCQDGSYRYGFSGVHLQTTQDGYQVEATDGKSFVRVVGTCELSEQYPCNSSLASAPNGQHESIVPASEWKKAFKAIPTGRTVTNKPILGNLAAVQGPQTTTLHSVDGNGGITHTEAINIDSRWPNTDDVLPKDAAALSIKIDAKRLAELLQIAAQFSGDDAYHSVTLHVFTESKPLKITARKDSQEFIGLIMPLAK